jgi:lipopolysaccharide export system protein LptA
LSEPDSWRMKDTDLPFCRVLFFLFLSAHAYAFNQSKPFDIQADTLTVRQDLDDMIAEGHVRVVQTTSSLSADYLRYDRRAGTLEGEGHVILRDKQELMVGDHMTYDLGEQSGEVTGAKGSSAGWFFQGEDWQKERDYYIGRYASFTSCDLPDAHWHVGSSRVNLIPNRMFWAWDNKFYADHTPVFYTPFSYKYLDEKKIVFQVSPGYDSNKGYFAKTKTTFRFSEKAYDRFLYDYYSNSGSGVGNEIFYQDPGRYKGSLFGYYIDPHGEPEPPGAPNSAQYNIRMYHWQKINEQVTLQSNTNLRNNVAFNSQYFPQDPNQSVNDITSSIALTQQTNKINQRLVVEQVAGTDPGADPLFGETHTQIANYPSYQFTMYDTPLWSPKAPVVSSTTFYEPNRLGPLLMSINGSTQYTYLRQDQKNHANAAASVNLSEAYALSRNWSVTPRIAPSVSWKDIPNPGTATVAGTMSGYLGRINLGSDLRWRPFSAVTVDQIQNWVGRFEQNGLNLDTSASDHGVEVNKLNWSLYWRPSFLIQLRSFSGYDMRSLTNEDPNAYLQRRFDPWTSEFTIQPRHSTWQYFLREQIAYYPTRTSLWEVSASGKLKYNTIIQTGILYNRGQPGLVTWNNTFGLYLSPAWRVDAVLNALVPNDAMNATMISSEFHVKRDMHCWISEFVFRNRPPYSREYLFLMNLKLGKQTEREISDPSLESQFYPWRNSNMN